MSNILAKLKSDLNAISIALHHLSVVDSSFSSIIDLHCKTLELFEQVVEAKGESVAAEIDKEPISKGKKRKGEEMDRDYKLKQRLISAFNRAEELEADYEELKDMTVEQSAVNILKVINGNETELVRHTVR